MLHFTDGGLQNVWLANGYTVDDTSYGEAISIQNLPGLVQAICKVLIRKKSRLTNLEFRYIRQAMLMSQATLGRALGRSDQSVAVWEKRGQIPKFADSMIRILYAVHCDGNEKVKNIIQSPLNEEDHQVHIVMKESAMGWLAVETDDPPPNPQRTAGSLLAA